MTDLRIVAIYEKMVATQPGIERKGKANPYTSMNGNMFSFITKEGEIALRLPEETRRLRALTNYTGIRAHSPAAVLEIGYWL